jgi:MFS family permease
MWIRLFRRSDVGSGFGYLGFFDLSGTFYNLLSNKPENAYRILPGVQEMNVPDDKTGLVFTAMSAGLTIGAFTWGLAVDIIGRKWGRFVLQNQVLSCRTANHICFSVQRYYFDYVFLCT